MLQLKRRRSRQENGRNVERPAAKGSAVWAGGLSEAFQAALELPILLVFDERLDCVPVDIHIRLTSDGHSVLDGMNPQAFLLHKRVVAHVAFVRFFSGVCHFVPAELARGDERLGAGAV